MSDHSDTLDTLGIPSLPMFDLIGNDFALFNDLGELPFRPYPVRLSALWFAVCRRGHARLRIDLREVTLEAGQMLIILPDQIMEQEELADGLEGMLMAVSRRFVEGVIPSVERLAPLMMQVRLHPCLPLTPQEMEALGEYHAFLRRKVRLKDSPFRAEIAQGLLMALFYEVYAVHLRLQSQELPSGVSGRWEEPTRAGMAVPGVVSSGSSSTEALSADTTPTDKDTHEATSSGPSPSNSAPKSAMSTPSTTPPTPLKSPTSPTPPTTPLTTPLTPPTPLRHRPRNRHEELFGRFMELLPKHVRKERSVAWYADRLCVTPKHLTVAVREASGRTAGQWIDEFVVLEAKVLLRSTDLTVQEISVRLNFANQSFFGKYFRRVAGMSPRQYRAQ